MNTFSLTIRISRAITSRIRNAFYRILGVRIAGYVELRKVEIPRSWNEISIAGPSCLDRGVALLATGNSAAKPKIEIAGGVYINRNTIIDAHQSIVIGKHVMIGPNCYITDGDHGTHAAAHIVDQPMICSPVSIGEGAWLGANVTVLKGVSIGNGAVVGGGSVVTKDVPPLVIVAGVPARQIGVRNALAETEEFANIEPDNNPQQPSQSMQESMISISKAIAK